MKKDIVSKRIIKKLLKEIAKYFLNNPIETDNIVFLDKELQRVEKREADIVASIDCELLLKEDTPEALVLAILCDFKQKKPKKVVQYIIEKLQEHTKDNVKVYNDYLLMLETLSTNRELKETVKEIEMLRETRYQDLPSYEIGIEKGLEKGLEKGRNEAKKASAKEMKKLGFDLEIISKVTKLSIKEIKSL